MMTIKALKKLIENLPENTPVLMFNDGIGYISEVKSRGIIKTSFEDLSESVDAFKRDDLEDIMKRNNFNKSTEMLFIK